MKDCMLLDHQLAGSQMPPHVGVGYTACRHGEQAHRQDGHEHTPRLQKLDHQCEDNTLPGSSRYRIGSPRLVRS
jgi:hypothetical protein